VFSGAGLKRFFVRGVEAKDAFWNVAKPTNLAASGQLDVKGADWYNWVSWIFWASSGYLELIRRRDSLFLSQDDDFVDELRRTAQACKLFLWAPIFHLAAGGLDSIINSMGGAMVTDGVPSESMRRVASFVLFSFGSLTSLFILFRRRSVLNPFNPLALICVIPISE